jgi:intein-encoded DNA endonuclease-like protein
MEKRNYLLLFVESFVRALALMLDPSKDQDIAKLSPSEIVERYFRNQRIDMNQDSSRIYSVSIDAFLATK